MTSLLSALAMIPAMTLLARAQPTPAVAEPPPPEVSPAPPPPAPSELDTLTHTARNVARDGRCEALPAIAQRVRELDAAYYQRVFAIDPTIAGCRQIDPSVMRQGLPPSQTVEQPSAVPFPASGETGKDPGTAFWASGLTTVGGVALAAIAGNAHSTALGDVAALMIFVGPTVGHTYAGHTWNTGLGVRLAGAAGAVVGVGLMLRCIDGCSASDNNVAEAGVVLALGGSLAYLIGSLYEIATASEAAHEYNREHGIERTLTFAPIQARGGAAPGLALVGRF